MRCFAGNVGGDWTHVASREAKDDPQALRPSIPAALNHNPLLNHAAVKTEKDQLAQAQTELATLRAVGTQGQTVNQAQLAEIERRKGEVENLQKLLAAKEQKITDIDKQMARLRDESVQFRIQWEQARDRNADLLRQVEALARENAQLRSQLGGGTSRPDTTAPAATPTPTENAGSRVVQRARRRCYAAWTVSLQNSLLPLLLLPPRGE